MRLPGLITYAVRRCTAQTRRARERVWQVQTASFGDSIPDQTIIMLLGLVFCCIQ
jgi:hypothetical protein